MTCFVIDTTPRAEKWRQICPGAVLAADQGTAIPVRAGDIIFAHAHVDPPAVNPDLVLGKSLDAEVPTTDERRNIRAFLLAVGQLIAAGAAPTLVLYSGDSISSRSAGRWRQLAAKNVLPGCPVERIKVIEKRGIAREIGAPELRAIVVPFLRIPGDPSTDVNAALAASVRSRETVAALRVLCVAWKAARRAGEGSGRGIALEAPCNLDDWLRPFGPGATPEKTAEQAGGAASGAAALFASVRAGNDSELETAVDEFLRAVAPEGLASDNSCHAQL